MSSPLTSPPRPALARLAEVELRKMTDTRSGRWLLAVVGLLMTATVVVMVFVARPEHRAFADLAAAAPVAGHLLIPVVGVLSVTAEWSHRTALTTFGLIPDRTRVAVAKILAALALAAAVLATGLLLAVAGRILAAAAGRGAGGWALPGTEFTESLIGMGIGVTSGVAFGMLFMNAPLAIVLMFLVPIGIGTLVEAVSALRPVEDWVDHSASLHAVLDSGVTAERLGRLAVGLAIWVVVPLAAGLVRLRRREIR
jgi:hypothetical protein